MIETLKILINAQLTPGGHHGGVEQFIIGLVHGLGNLHDGDEEYIVISQLEEQDWLKQYLGLNQRIVACRSPQLVSSRWEPAKRMLEPMHRGAGRLWKRIGRHLFRHPFESQVPASDGFYESLKGDVIHFPYQIFTRCKLPMIFNPHDLQHRHYPQFFTKNELEWREMIYPAGCKYSHSIVAESQWVRDDLIQEYGIDRRKIFVIPMGSPTELYEPVTNKIVTDTIEKFQLAHTFALYPAQTWPHKNHIRLLEAMKLLQDRNGQSINLVCTGKKNLAWPAIERRIQELHLNDQVSFLGFVPPQELRALYHSAQFVVFPSLYEGGGFPILEAFLEGTPIACSAATSLPEYGGDAVHLFDPTSVESIAQALRIMTTDSVHRDKLRRRGSERIRLFTWQRTAKTYRALYRKVARRRLSDEDCYLLSLASDTR